MTAELNVTDDYTWASGAIKAKIEGLGLELVEQYLGLSPDRRVAMVERKALEAQRVGDQEGAAFYIALGGHLRAIQLASVAFVAPGGTNA